MAQGYIYEPVITTGDFKEQILIIGQVQSGKTNFILNTVEDALLKYDYDCALVIGGTTNLLLSQTEERFRDFTNIKMMNMSSLHKIVHIVPNSKFILSCLKGDDALRKVINFLEYDINYLKILIIDDESDFASQFNSKTKSTIYNHIINIYNNSKSCTLLSVTATPYADILVNDSFDHTKIYKLEPGDGYTGIDYFCDNANLFSKIDIEENIISKNSFWIDILNDHVKRVYNSNFTCSQLIIMSNRIKNHIEIYSKLLEIINLIILSGYKYYYKYFDESYNFEKIEKIFISMHNKTFIANSDKDVEKDSNANLKNNSWKKYHSIIIGGNSISRGYTFKKLLTCVILDEKKYKLSADVLMQKARWFGYRKEENLIKYMKIYMSNKTIMAYHECRKLNDIVFNNNTKNEIINMIKNNDFYYIEPTRKEKNE